MSKSKFALGILVSLLSLCLEVSIQAQPRETKPETATISGLVTLKGEPARGVTVMLQVQRGGPNKPPLSRTDENGRFTFTGVAVGSYSISALAPGYFSPSDSGMGRGGQTINVAEGEKIDNISLDIRRGGVIAGRVTDSQGRPVVEETVNLSRLDNNGRPQNYYFPTMQYDMTRTDDRGAYRIFGAPEGRYLVSVGREQRPGSVSLTSGRALYPRAYYPGASDESTAKVIEVSEGSEVTDVDITLSEPLRTCEISGRVIDAATGQPIAGVEIVVGSLSPDGRPTGGWAGNGARSSSNGEFRMIGVLPGRYSLSIRPDVRYSPAGRPDVNAGEGFISDPVVVTVDDDTQGVEIKARQGASISGVAVIEGTNDPKILSRLSQVNLYVSVRPRRPDTAQFMTGVSSRVYSDGSFHARGLQAGKAFISLPGSLNAVGFVVARIEHNGAAIRDGIDVEAGQQLTGVRLVLNYGAHKIRGELKIVGGALPTGLRFRVIARTVDSQMPQGTLIADVDARGQFVIENAPSGEYELRASPAYTPNTGQLDMQTMRLIALFTVRVVVAGADPQPVVLALDLSRKEGNQ